MSGVHCRCPLEYFSVAGEEAVERIAHNCYVSEAMRYLPATGQRRLPSERTSSCLTFSAPNAQEAHRASDVLPVFQIRLKMSSSESTTMHSRVSPRPEVTVPQPGVSAAGHVRSSNTLPARRCVPKPAQRRGCLCQAGTDRLRAVAAASMAASCASQIRTVLERCGSGSCICTHLHP